MSTDLAGILWTVSGVVIAATIGGIATVLVKRFRSRASEPEMWEKIQELSVTVYGGRDKEGHEVTGMIEQLSDVRRRNTAQARVIRALISQWPSPKIPRLNPDDINDIEEDTIPATWRVKPTSA